MTSTNEYARQAWRLACVICVAAALAGCGLAQDVARQAGLPDNVFQALGFPDRNATTAAPAPSAAAKPKLKHAARRSHRRRHHVTGHADENAVAAADLGAAASAKDADAAAGFTDHVPPPVATGNGDADTTKDAAVTPRPDEHADATPVPAVPSRVSRRQVEEKVYVAIQHCKELHRQGGLDTFQQTAECMGPRIWAAWHEANYPYMDLIGLYVSTLERAAARLDRHEITEAEFEQDMTRMQTRIAAEEQRRNRPAAQLTNISDSGGLAPTE